jgi:hypothetical protein
MAPGTQDTIHEIHIFVKNKNQNTRKKNATTHNTSFYIILNKVILYIQF